MRTQRKMAISLLCITLTVFGLIPVVSGQATQDTAFALQRGFRTGYSDGYMAGYRDTIDSLTRSLNRHDEYLKANRTYAKDYGSLQDFRDGYQQGFESGYDTGFERRSFEASLPTGLKRRGVVVGDRQDLVADNNEQPQSTGVTTTPNTVSNQPAQTDPTYETARYTPSSNSIIVIPRDTELILELQNDLSTERSREGEKFTAKVVSPSELNGAIVEGRVSKITQPGRIKRRSELSLTFDRILLSDQRWSNLSGTLIEVMPVKGDNIKRVDVEGTAIGQSSLKSDAMKVGGATGAGLVTGAVIGGPVGAAVGAGMGAAFGVGAVVIERGKHVRLSPNQQLRIKTAYETQIR
ncbi:MAG TPA: hypothetical protein VGO43_14975 [Pyrinomonadaceae bacterium]|jgi:hypothetical protein|nr:hypothetical protein [Pyrinomonadaceae bacterium]